MNKLEKYLLIAIGIFIFIIIIIVSLTIFLTKPELDSSITPSNLKNNDSLLNLNLNKGIICNKDTVNISILSDMEEGSCALFKRDYGGAWQSHHYFNLEGYNYGIESHPISNPSLLEMTVICCQDEKCGMSNIARLEVTNCN